MNSSLLFKKYKSNLPLWMLVVALLSLSLTTEAQTRRYVRQGGTGNGTSWANASGNLQDMINASGVQEVWVTAGTYKPGGNTNTNRTISFSMKNGVTIYGGFVGNETALNQRPAINPTTGQPSSSILSGEIGNSGSADNSFHVVNNDQTGIDNTAILDGFVIRGGNANDMNNGNDGTGGGMLNVSTSPTVRNCSFLSNSASDYGGGGMYNYGSNPSLTNCFFQGNTTSGNGGGMYNVTSSPSLTNCSFQTNSASGAGGGMHNESSNNPNLTNCSFQNNTANDGAGLYNYSSNPSLTNCSFLSNTASGTGGGMYNITNSSAILTNCTFQSNTATTTGGGVYNDRSNPSLTNCSFQSNTANSGGGIYNSNSTYSPINCSFLNNSALTSGGGIYNNASSVVNATNGSFQGNSALASGGAIYTERACTLTNCVLFGNGAANTLATVRSNVTITLRYSLIEASETGFTDGGNNSPTPTSPFISTSSNQLKGCALAINAGSNSAYSTATGPANDLAGNTRVFASTIDMGAYEYQAAPSAGLTITNPATTTATQGSSFSSTFSALGGTSPYSFSLASGTLPTSLSLSTTGGLSGFLTQTGSFSIAVWVADANGCSRMSAAYTLTVNPEPCPPALQVTTTNDAGAGSLRQAMLNVAATTCAAPFTITVSVSGTINLASALPDIEKNITFIGPGASNLTIRRNSGGNYRLFNITPDRTVRFDGFTLANGSASDQGGAIYFSSGSLTVANCVFVDNQAGLIAGAIRSGGNLVVTNCQFVNNRGFGAQTSGGAISQAGGSCAITNSTFMGNQATGGGAFFNDAGAPTPIFTNCTFSANTATVYGGGLWLRGGGTLVNCTITNNSASLGGGISAPDVNALLKNCILVGNTGDSDANLDGTAAAASSYNLIGANGSGGLTNGSNGNIIGVSNPLLAPLANYGGTTQTHALLPGSPAINAGTASGAPNTDQRGISRVSTTDMGSFESRGFTLALSSGSSQTATAGTTFANPLRTTVSSDNNEPVNGGVVTYTGPGSGAGINPISVTASIGTNTASASVTANATAGTYNVAATARGASPTINFSLTNSSATPTITGFATLNTSVCAGSPITFTATVGNVTGSYNYTLTNGSSTSIASTTSATAFSRNLTAAGSGSQSFTLIVSVNGQSARSVTNVTVVQPPILTISYPGTRYCNRGDQQPIDPTRTITADFPMGSGAYTSSPAGLSIVAATGRVDTRASSPGSYTITYTYTSTAVCSVVTASAAMTIVGAPQFVNLSRIQPSCATPTGTISVTFTGNGTLEYSINNGSTWQTSNVFSGLAPGSYDILARSQSETGCVSNVSLISINSLQNTVRISYPAGPYCRNASTTYPASVTSTGGSGTFTSSPAGLSIDAAGTIYPNESEPGSYTVNYVSSTCTNVTATAAITIIDNLIIGLNVTQPTCATVTGTINASVTGLSGVEYNINGGPWQTSGLFSGLAAGQLYTVRARLASLPTCESNLTDIPINAVPTPPSVTNPTVTTATIGVAFSQSFTAVGGTGNASFSLANGATLPPGLTLNAVTGVLSGTPTALGSFTITVRATNANSCSAVGATYTLTVQEPFSPIRYVRQGGAGTGSGSSWTNASADLQSQINLAGVTQVWVAAGTYKPGGDANTNRNISFRMKNDVAIYGGFVGNETVLSQRPVINPTAGQPSSSTLSAELGNLATRSDNAFHVINNDQTGITNTAVLDGFVITGAYADGAGNDNAGGGMINVLTSPTLRNCSFLSNTVSNSGGGMYNFNSNVSLTNCVFLANAAFDAGGMYNGAGSTASLINCTFQGNTATNGGGGMQNRDNSNVRLTNCVFQSNATLGVGNGVGFGGGVFNGNSNPSLTNCSFRSNTAQFGGGMYSLSSSPVLINCDFQSNGASRSGGGLYIGTVSSLTLINCSFQSNSATTAGAAIYNDGSCNLTNGVLFGNQAGNAIAGYGTVTLRYSLIDASETDYTGSNNLTITVSPFISPTSTQLNSCAPAINTGSNAAYTTANGPATDLAGNPRVFGGTIDMGAYEYQTSPNLGLTLTNPTTTTATQGSLFSGTFSASGGMAPYSFSLANGATLPVGLTLATTGGLSGTPTQTGIFSLTVNVFDALGCSGTSATYTLTVQDAFSPIRYVKPGGAGTGSGNSWANASADLQSQIDLTGVTQVWVAAGKYKPGGDANTDQSVSFSMKNGVTIYGGFANTGSPTLAERNPTTFATFLSGDIGTPNDNSDNSFHVISNDGNGLNATAILDGFVITGGNGGDYGGGMYNSGSSPSIANCVFQTNSAGEGAGMYNTSSSPVLNNCVFQANTASVGGGMSNDNSSPTLTTCSFLNNQGETYGGGMVTINASNPNLTNCLFQDNSGSFFGGGIYNDSSDPRLTNCSFQSNSGGFFGGAIYNNSGNPVLTNCSFQANTADDGAAINSQSGNPRLANGVLFGNGGANTISGTVSASYSLFEASGTDYTGANNLTTTVSPFASTTSTQLNGCALAINTGSSEDYSDSSGPGNDLAGNTRVFGSFIDMGAYEYQTAPNPGLALTNPTTTTATQGSLFNATFSASGGTGPYSFSLANGATLPTGLTLAATGELSGTPTQTGIFSITVSAFDAQGCSGTSATYTLTVNAATPTIAGLAATAISVCTGSPITFTATIGNVTGSYTYTLTNGVSTTMGATSSLAFNQTLIADGSGVQSFTLTVEAAEQRTLATTNVTVNAIPVPTLSANFGGTLTCAQTSLTLTANGGTTYAFSGPGESTLGIVSQHPTGGTAVVNAAGTYSVTVTSSGCTATTSIDISQDISLPTVTINPSSATLTCTNPSATLTANGTGTYLWNTGATSQTITATTVGTYSVTLTGTNRCSGSASVSVSADQNAPQLSISPSSATLTCTSSTASLTVIGTGTVFWSTGSTDRIIPITSAGTYSVTLTSSGGCTATSSVTISQDHTAPSVSIGASTTALTCTSPSATLTAIGTGSYLWSTGSTSQTITATAAGTYSVTLTAANGCSATATASVTADQATPPLSITASSTLLTCTSSTASLTAMGTGSMRWSTGSTDTQISVSSSGTYSVTLTAPSGCTTSTSITINQDTGLPSVSITPSTGTPAGTTLTCTNPTVTLTANGTGTYVWSTGSPSSTVSVSTAGIYSITLTGENGCSSVASATVTTDQTTPPLSITASQTLLSCSSPTANLAAIGTGAFRWTTGSTDAQITVSTGGTYSVTLTAPNGCTTSTSITLNQDTTIPTVSVTASSTLLNCANPTASLTAIGAGAVRWSTGSADTQITVNAAGTYSVTLTTPNGCSASTSITINQNSDLPSVNINASSPTITCLSPTVSLTAMGTGDVRWSTGSTNTIILVSEAGIYSVTLTGSNGCSSTTSFSVGQDTSQPTLSISPTSTTLSCSTPSITLTANGTGTYQWSTGASSQTIIVTSAGTYSVTLTGTNGCSSTNSVSITADQNAPAVSISPSSATLTCASPIATLTALGTGSLRWNTGSTEPQITVSTAGTYSVTLTAPSGCSASTSITIDQDTNLPSVSISPSTGTPAGTTLTCASPSVTLTANGTGSYVWSTGATSQTISATSAGTYSVTLTALNRCSAQTSIEVVQDNNLPLISIQSSTTILSCTSPTATLAVSGSPGTYLWSTGATSQTISATSAGTYSVTLTAENGCSAFTSVLVEQGADQTIGLSQQPASSSSVTVGSNVTTQVIITGQASAFQWYKDNLSQPLASQTSAQLTLANVQLPDAGSYFVVVSGPCNSLTSTAFSLSITTPITALTLTASANPNPVQVGQSATLTATVLGGTSPYTYSFAGPGTITPAGNTATVSGLAAGVYSFTISATDATQPTAKQATTTVSLTVNAVETMPFAISGVTTLACSPITSNRFSISFDPRYSGLTGQPISFSVANEMLPTTQPGPYTLQLYTDNATITLQARQQGTNTPTSFSYNWLEACRTSETPNTPPRVVTALPNQTAKVGDYFTYVIPEGTFADSETPLSLRLSATGLPAGLSFSGATLSGTPSTTVGSPFTVSITATDPGGLSVSTPLLLTILPATTPVDPTTPFAITGVTTISCTPVADRININFAPQYAGLNGQPIAFEIVNERAPTTDPAPYSLTLYRDNPVITLRARQTGSVEEASFSYNWLAACSTAGQDNTPPRINSPVGSQTATVGKAFTLNLANTFADQETPNQLTLSASGLPAGLVLVGTAISGTPSVSGVSSVILTATDGGGLTNTTSFELTVSPASSTTTTPPSEFAITGVQTVSCVTVSSGLRSVTFLPQYGGVNGQPISFRVENELGETTANGPYTLNLYTDNPTISLKATQQNSPGEASFNYNWLAACTAPARLGVGEAESRLEVTVLGNPVEGDRVELEIRGASNQWLSVELVDQQGKSISHQHLEKARLVERLSLPVRTSRGLLLLSVQTANQQHQVKIVVK